MINTDNIHQLRLPEPRPRAGKSHAMLAAVQQIALSGRKVSILDPRVPARTIELPAAGGQRPENEGSGDA